MLCTSVNESISTHYHLTLTLLPQVSPSSLHMTPPQLLHFWTDFAQSSSEVFAAMKLFFSNETPSSFPISPSTPHTNTHDTSTTRNIMGRILIKNFTYVIYMLPALTKHYTQSVSGDGAGGTTRIEQCHKVWDVISLFDIQGTCTSTELTTSINHFSTSSAKGDQVL